MKICIQCNENKPFSAFVPKSSGKDGYEIRCRKCRSIKYNKSTPELLSKKIYRSQVNNSKLRNHPLPLYSLTELTTWLLSNPKFNQMYSTWVASGYAKDLAPSIDRIDDSLPYSLNNIQLMIWKENRNKGAKSKKYGDIQVNHKPVEAYTKDGILHKRYISIAEAMRDMGGKGTQSWGIVTVCNGLPVKDGRGNFYTPKTYKGFVWKWAS